MSGACHCFMAWVRCTCLIMSLRELTTFVLPCLPLSGLPAQNLDVQGANQCAWYLDASRAPALKSTPSILVHLCQVA